MMTAKIVSNNHSPTSSLKSKLKDPDEELNRSESCGEKLSGYETDVDIKPSSTKKRRIIPSGDEDSVDRDSEEENSENMVVPSSSTRKRRQIQSDTEDEHLDRTPGNGFKDHAISVKKVKRNLQPGFGQPTGVKSSDLTDEDPSSADDEIPTAHHSSEDEFKLSKSSTSDPSICEEEESDEMSDFIDDDSQSQEMLSKSSASDPSISEEEESDDMSDFIVDDDSQSQNVPVFAKPELEEAYKRFVQMILSSILDRDFLSSLQDEQDPYFDQAKDTIDKVIESKKNLVGSTTWVQFKEMLENCSVLESEPLPTIKETTCEACRRNPRNLTERMIFYSAYYNGVKVLPSEMEFSVGCFCAERGSLYHDLHQHHFHLTQSCKEKINKVREAMGIESDQNIVECCINDEEWLNVLFTTFLALLNKADEWAVDGKKRKHMKAHCASFH